MDENEHITDYPPGKDIDQYIENVNFRIERMSAESVWLAAYTHKDGEPDHHYDVSCDEDGGLHITHRQEPSRD